MPINIRAWMWSSLKPTTHSLIPSSWVIGREGSLELSMASLKAEKPVGTHVSTEKPAGPKASEGAPKAPASKPAPKKAAPKAQEPRKRGKSGRPAAAKK